MSPERSTSGFPVTIRNLFKRSAGARLAAVGVASVLALMLVVGVGAAPSPVDPVAGALGLGGDHGSAVSGAVQDARESLEDGEDVGPAVSEAACTAAHDRTTLPESAQNAPGQQDREPKDCTQPSNVEEDDGEDTAEADAGNETEVQGDTTNHGSAVSQAVHEAKAAAQEAGENVGPAVSEAACTAAHDRTTLPEGAQNAPGQQGRETKDCTHPSNADDGEAGPDLASNSNNNGGSQGHGQQSAPGQLKKKNP